MVKGVCKWFHIDIWDFTRVISVLVRGIGEIFNSKSQRIGKILIMQVQNIILRLVQVVWLGYLNYWPSY